jgi:hypothetical protein
MFLFLDTNVKKRMVSLYYSDLGLDEDETHDLINNN